MVSYLDQTGLEHTLEKLRNQMYPVGSLYFSTNSTSPATIYGGTWERYGKGRTLVSVNESDTDFTAGKTGGEKTHVLSHTVGEYYGYVGISIKDDGNDGVSWSGLSIDGEDPRGYFEKGSLMYFTARDLQGTQTDRPITQYTASVDVPVVQPYVAVYIWRRTA